MNRVAAIYGLVNAYMDEAAGVRSAGENGQIGQLAQSLGRSLGVAGRTIELIKQEDPALVEQIQLAHGEMLQTLTGKFPDQARKPADILDELEAAVRAAAPKVPTLDFEAVVHAIRNPRKANVTVRK